MSSLKGPSGDARSAKFSVKLPRTITHDPQFQDRFPWLPAAEHGTDLLPTPIKFVDEGLAPPRKAPTPGQHTDAVLRELGLDDARISALREAGVAG